MAFLSLRAAPGSCTGQAVSSTAPSSAPATDLPSAPCSPHSLPVSLLAWVALVPVPALASRPLQGDTHQLARNK